MVENSMSLRGISGVVLGYSPLDGGAARVQEGKVSLFFDFIGGRPTVCCGKIYKACSLHIICVNLRSLCVEIAYLSICHICNIYNCMRFCLRRKTLHPRYVVEKYIKRVHCIKYVLISGICVERAYLSICHICNI